MDCSTSGFPVLRYLQELAQTHGYLQELAQTHDLRVRDAVQPSHPLSSPSPAALSLSQHQVICSEVDKPGVCFKQSEVKS